MTKATTLLAALQANLSSDKSITFISGISDEHVVSYRELHDRALAMLHVFQSHGLSAGDELIIFLRDNETFVVAFWAAVMGGIVPVPVAVGIRDEHRAKLYRIFDKLERPHLFTDQDNLERLSSYAFENVLSEAFAALKDKTVLLENLGDMQELGKVHEADSNDTAFIQFSSGSTSEPKGVVLTHKNLLTNMYAIAQAARYTDADTSLSWMPLTHDMGLIGFHLNMVLCKMNQCLIPTDLFSRRPLLWMQKVSEKKATVICSPNFGYKHYLKALGDKTPDDVELSSVKAIINGAEPISVDLIDEFMDRMAAYGLQRETMMTGYGLAEASLVMTLPEYGTRNRAININRQKVLTGEKVEVMEAGQAESVSFAMLGQTIPDTFLRITFDDKQVAEGVIGDIEISGDNVTQGYYHNPEANKAALTGDGWLKTGDLGFMQNGELVITGRAKEIIFANGQNYYPHDLESLLHHLNKLELGKVVACGVHQDVSQIEELIIFVLYRGDLTEFVDISKQVTRVLNEQLGLEVTHVIPVKRVLKTTSGKIQRVAMGKDYLDGEYTGVLAELDNLLHSKVDTGTVTSDLEGQLLAIFNSVLDEKKLALNDNFFEAGISSLALAEIHQRIDDEYPGKIDITDMFEYQTVAEVAQFLASKL